MAVTEFGIRRDLLDYFNTNQNILNEIAVANKIQLGAAHSLKVILQNPSLKFRPFVYLEIVIGLDSFQLETIWY